MARRRKPRSIVWKVSLVACSFFSSLYHMPFEASFKPWKSTMNRQFQSKTATSLILKFPAYFAICCMQHWHLVPTFCYGWTPLCVLAYLVPCRHFWRRMRILGALSFRAAKTRRPPWDRWKAHETSVLILPLSLVLSCSILIVPYLISSLRVALVSCNKWGTLPDVGIIDGLMGHSIIVIVMDDLGC